MRRSGVLLRGSKGFGWYQHYRQNPQDFAKYTLPTPFDWSAGNIQRPKVYFDIATSDEVWGRVQFELASDVVPKTVENFLNLVKGQNPKNLTYKSTKFHTIRKGQLIMAGDVEGGNGKLSHAASNDRFFSDENYIIPHSSRGLLR